MGNVSLYSLPVTAAATSRLAKWQNDFADELDRFVQTLQPPSGGSVAVLPRVIVSLVASYCAPVCNDLNVLADLLPPLLDAVPARIYYHDQTAYTFWWSIADAKSARNTEFYEPGIRNSTRKELLQIARAEIATRLRVQAEMDVRLVATYSTYKPIRIDPRVQRVFDALIAPRHERAAKEYMPTPVQYRFDEHYAAGTNQWVMRHWFCCGDDKQRNASDEPDARRLHLQFTEARHPTEADRKRMNEIARQKAAEQRERKKEIDDLRAEVAGRSANSVSRRGRSHYSAKAKPPVSGSARRNK